MDTVHYLWLNIIDNSQDVPIGIIYKFTKAITTRAWQDTRDTLECHL
jgi:hypothetical protein